MSLTTFCWYLLLLSTTVTVHCQPTSSSITKGSYLELGHFEISLVNELRQMRQQIEANNNKNNNNCQKTRLSRVCDGPSAVHSNYGGFWTSGQRANRTNCENSNPWMWKPYHGVTTQVYFADWKSGEPNCGRQDEHCLSFMYKSTYSSNDFQWNDINCAWPLCPLCELGS